MLRRLLAFLHLQSQGTMLTVGSPAPTFVVSDHLGRTVRSQELLGKRWILWFYPKADTPG
ncbi:MAG: redoxin domain-containing protein [Planctomycetota bacterium]